MRPGWMSVFLVLLVASAATQAETRALVIVGLGGTEKYEESFQSEAELVKIGLTRVASDLVLLTSADREAVRTEIEALGERVQSSDNFVLIYIGHGTYDGQDFRFNVPGRDFTGKELNDWLGEVDANHQLIVAASSSSGALLPVLEADKRTTITATRSGDQKNATVFSRYFAGALSADAADINKDGRISANEAFDYAKTRVEGFYDEKGQMATEHPQTQGVEPVIVLAELREAKVDPRTAHLVTRRESLELDIEKLKARKSELATDDYLAELQRLLLELAMVESQIDEETAEGGAI